MKKLFVCWVLFFGFSLIRAQVVFNPNIAIKPSPAMSIYKVEMTDTTTTVVVRMINDKQLPAFSLRTKSLFIRPVSDPKRINLKRSTKAPFAPEKHAFTALNEIFEFTLVFGPLPKNTKYFDLLEDLPKREFYLQGIILDPALNKMVSRGFQAFGKGDREGALLAFKEMAEADLYFEYGLAYFNVIYLLVQLNRIPEAQVWYDKFKERFFYDKQLYENEFVRLGIRQKLK
jgi:hypothetical protein